MTRTAAAVSGPKAFAEAGITPADVDVFAMYDSFTYTVLVVLEDVMRNRRPQPGTMGILAAMGPGFCSELVLLKW